MAFRNSMPASNPIVPAAPDVLVGDDIDGHLLLSSLPGKYLQLKTGVTRGLAGLAGGSPPTSGFDVMAKNWRGLGSLGTKMALLGILSPGTNQSGSSVATTAASTIDSSVRSANPPEVLSGTGASVVSALTGGSAQNQA
jgi:hypothetical protein